ncbi:MAG: LETM1 domain-containing protein [Deltaproteobacteria bacterium]|nr:LETM1 domain-containing protein [Deltaproteobacteria bacterium]
MKFSKHGWFTQYLAFRRKNPFPAKLPTLGVKVVEDSGVHNEVDQAVYYFLQPTGLVYGAPVKLPFTDVVFPESQYHDVLDRMMLTLLDATFAVLVTDHIYQTDGMPDYNPDYLQVATDVVSHYYLKAPEIYKPKDGFITRLKHKMFGPPDELTRFEQNFIYRVSGGKDLSYQIFFNNFMFVDLQACVRLQRLVLMGEELNQGLIDKVYQSIGAQREALLNLIIMAAFTNAVVEPEEKRIIDQFFRTSHFSKEKLLEFRLKMENGLALENIHIPDMPWVIRRYLLEVVLMMTLLDRSISEEEEAMLSRVVERLGLWEDELAQSRIALESFLLAQGDKLQFFKKRFHLLNVGERFKEKAAIAVRKNVDRLVTEINETKELSALLVKSTKTPLTPDEKKKVQEQIADILKTIPALAIFALPGGGLILPVVIKILPFNLMPSAFEDKPAAEEPAG